MLTVDLFESDFETNDLTLIDALRDFLPLAVKTLELPQIPKISLEKSIEKSNVPTFGRFTNDDDHVYVHVANRNPNDILRTLAHELVHYKQRTEHELGSGSWHTGSPAENQAHELAGVIMRNFNSKYPQYLRMKPVILPGGNGVKELDETWSKKYKKSINCNNPKGFSQKAHCAGRKARKAGRKTKSSSVSEAVEGCPPATQDITLNLKNRQKAIDEYHYGPLNPNLPNEEYWQELADKWNTSDIASVKQNRCGNCGAFDLSEDMQACIAKGIGSEPGSSAMDAVDAGELGYCKFLKFKCASKRTCDAWIEGGPITEGKRCDSKGAVPELKAALDNRKKELNKLSDKQVYAKIDKIMTRIANTYNLTGQELHDMWTERYGEIPDTYILEAFTSNITPTTPLENLPPIVKGLIYKWELMNWGTTDPDLAHDRAGYIHERDLAAKKLAQLGFAISKSQIGVLLTHLRTRQSIDIDGEDVREWEPFIRTADLSLGLAENFADGKKPGRKGLAKRSGVNCKQSVTKLRSIAKHSSGERQRMAHWCANMKAGKK